MRTLKLQDQSGAARPFRIGTDAFSSGADGAIYIVDGEPGLVAKIYHEPGKDPDRLKKIQAMLADPPGLPAIEANGRRYVQIAWPVGWLEDEEGRFVGYVMPAVDLSRATVLENFLAKKTRALAGLPESYGYRLTAAANLAAVAAELHAHGHHIIDLKPINLNLYTDAFFMAVLDCDGFSVRGENGQRYPAHQFSDGYICPEALQQSLPPQALGEAQDRFALAVVLFQLLNQGLHPFQGIPAEGATVPPTNGERIKQDLYAYGRVENPAIHPSPWSIHTFFDDDTRALFDRAFTARHDRPSAEEWHRHLEVYADIHSGMARVCEHNSEHIHFSKGCPWCALENRLARRPAPGTNKSSKRDKNKEEPGGGVQRGGQAARPQRSSGGQAESALETYLSKYPVGVRTNYDFRLEKARELAVYLAYLHKSGRLISDVTRGDEEMLYVVVRDNGSGITVEYTCPEAFQQSVPPHVFGENQDRFALAVIIFQLLNRWLHPFEGEPVGGMAPLTLRERIKNGLYAYGQTENPLLRPSPRSVHEYLEPETRELFERAFATHENRPSAQEWSAHLAALESANLPVPGTKQSKKRKALREQAVRQAQRLAQMKRSAPPAKAKKRIIPHFLRKLVAKILPDWPAAIPLLIVAIGLFVSPAGDELRYRLFDNYAVELNEDWQKTSTGSAPYIDFLVKESTVGQWNVSLLSLEQEQGGGHCEQGFRKAERAADSRFRLQLDCPLKTGKNHKLKVHVNERAKDESRNIIFEWQLQPSGEAVLSDEEVFHWLPW